MLYTWEMIIFILWNIPSIILYIFVLFQLIFKSGYNSSFFVLAILMGIVDLSNHVTIWFYFKLILYPMTSPMYFLINKNNFIFVYMSFTIYYFTRVRELLLLSTTFNRFTAIYFPHKQTKIWNKILIPAIAFSILFPILTTFNNLFGSATIFPFSDKIDGSFVIAVRVTSPLGITNAMASAIHTAITSIFTLIFNVASLTTLFLRTRNNRGDKKTNIPKKTEINLLMISCFDFLLDCLLVIHQLWCHSFSIREVYNDPIFDQLYILYPWIYDIVNLSRPYLLLIMCQKIRVSFLNLWKIDKFKSDSSVFVTVVSKY